MTPLYDQLASEHGDPADIPPTPTMDALLARHPAKTVDQMRRWAKEQAINSARKK